MKEFIERSSQAKNLSYRDLHIILDAVPTPVSWSTTPDGVAQFTNRSFRALFGYTEADFTSVDVWIDKFYSQAGHREKARKLWESLWKADASGVDEVDPIELEVRCKDGTRRTVLHRGIILHEMNIGIATFQDITDRKEAELALHRLAFEDPLTGLGNRRRLQSHWLQDESSTEARDQIASVLMVDLDGFKQINDRLGHDAGDAVLIAVADRLRRSVRKDDLICRFGGDEFVILLQNLMTFEHVEQLCWRIEAELQKPITVAGQSLTIGASIGASIYPQDGDGLEQLLARADEALYRVKAARKGGWQWYRVPVAA